jgi:hypothetical protein
MTLDTHFSGGPIMTYVEVFFSTKLKKIEVLSPQYVQITLLMYTCDFCN